MTIVIRDRTAIGLAAARARGKTGGRPRKLAQQDHDLARALLAEGSTPFVEVARRVRVAPLTLYGYFPGGRYGELPHDSHVALAPEGERQSVAKASAKGREIKAASND